MKAIKAAESEKYIIGGLLYEWHDLYPKLVARGVSADWFTDHQHTYNELIKLDKAGMIVELITAGDLIKGIDFDSYVDSYPSGVYVDHHLNLIEKRYKARQGRRKLIRYIEQLEDPLEDPEEVFLKMSLYADHMLKDAEETNDIKFQNMIERSRSPKKFVFLPPPIPALQKIVPAFMPGKMSVIGGRPKQGKTTLGLNLAAGIANPLGNINRPVGILSFEMEYDEVLNKIICELTSIDSQKYLAGTLTKEEQTTWEHTAEEVKHWPLHISDKIMNPWQIDNQIKIWRQKKGIQFVLLDYLTLIPTKGLTGHKTEQLGTISNILQSCIKRHHVHLCAISQLSRASQFNKEDQRPKLHHLRDSGVIEQDAYLVMLVYPDPDIQYPDEIYTPTIIDVAAHRGGRTGEVNSIFIKPFSKFVGEEHANEEIAKAKAIL